MNYKKIYDQLINRGKTRSLKEYFETHHIIPRCMGGTDDQTNLVKLTPEEHYLAHQLLVKIYPENYALKKAAAMMIVNRPNNKLYGWVRREFARAQSYFQSGASNSQYGTRWIHNKRLKQCRKIKKTDDIPNDWEIGYIVKWEKLDKETNKLKEKQNKINLKVVELRNLYNIYIKEGFDGVKKAGYKYSKPNLVSSFARYLPEFVPQNGKKRKS
jgi:hypothetical protein